MFEPARELFDALVAGGEAALLARLRSHDAEDQWLDFKEHATKDTSTNLKDDDLANLGKCLSGFHNTDGGVVVWGIRDPGKQGAPASRACTPGLPDAGWFKARLLEQLSRAVDPRFPGVDFAEVPLSNGAAALVMYVPGRGDGLPVEALNKHVRGFYLRAGESFGRVPSGILAAMLGRTPPSRCVAELVLPDANQAASIQVRNIGRGMASDLYVMIEREPFVRWESTGDSKKWVERSLGFYSAFSDLRVPPLVPAVTVINNIVLQDFRHGGAVPAELLAAGFTIRLRAGAGNDLANVTTYQFSSDLVASVAALIRRPGVAKVGPGEVWKHLLDGAVVHIPT